MTHDIRTWLESVGLGKYAEVFAVNDDGEKAYVIEGADADADCVDEAIASCPSECITRED